MHEMCVESKLKKYYFLDPLNIQFQGNATNTIKIYIQNKLDSENIECYMEPFIHK